ncbi:adenosylcobinamide-GDP ribazoletransferase [Anaerocolumna xylanovorans]|uniref:Adenosylcobinamide-GDP ribazoletransferase n=1 Tax=Anaerocolumna xylanovorans DSM 12503 TaxID=1121345 RepID=A0A1M7XYN1_9FIRM|nr:adenosylcobinamide-GDP ribazoletransferase [Anaerocolumna xylanovorans]SHO44180.1 cobalamin-5'-phosphate synthase [Anaerocolumna xylanovorans DSM 12503]
MSVIKSFFISFSIYSKIPVPQFEWKDEDMKYVLCFFPWVGAVIGILTYLWGIICKDFQLGKLLFAAIGTAIPLLVSGGFHVDGFMDTMDALHSYQTRERKLEILKDSHIGAFSVIQIIFYYLIFTGAYSEIDGLRAMAAVGAGYFLSRTISGIGVVTLKCAKKEGLLYLFSSKAHEKTVKISLSIQLFLCVLFLLYLSVLTGIAVTAGAILAFLYYRYRCYKEFGGITGDTAGYLVTLCEAVTVVIVSVCCIAKLI